MPSTNSKIFLFLAVCLHLCGQGVKPEHSAIVDTVSTIAKVVPYKEKLNDWGQGVKGTITDGTTKVKDLYHDAGVKATELKNSIKDTIEHDYDEIYKDTVKTFLHIPRYYYTYTLLACYAYSHILQYGFKYNFQMGLGVVFVVQLAGHFIQWNIRSYTKMKNEKSSKQKFEAY